MKNFKTQKQIVESIFNTTGKIVEMNKIDGMWHIDNQSTGCSKISDIDMPKPETGYLRNIKATIKHEIKSKCKFKRLMKLIRYQKMAQGRFDLARKFV